MILSEFVHANSCQSLLVVLFTRLTIDSALHVNRHVVKLQLLSPILLKESDNSTCDGMQNGIGPFQDDAPAQYGRCCYSQTTQTAFVVLTILYSLIFLLFPSVLLALTELSILPVFV